MSNFYSAIFINHGAVHSKQAPNADAHKCPGCGSHEFRAHRGAKACAYCRTVVGTTLSAPSQADLDMAKANADYRIAWLQENAIQAFIDRGKA